MALASAYVLPTNRLPEIFSKIRDGQAPERFTQQLLKDWGFASTNDRAFIPLLKTLGFLSPDGTPTQRYHDYRDHSRSKKVLGQAMRDAYSDIFLIKERPSNADRTAIEGKFKSFHNASDNVAVSDQTHWCQSTIGLRWARQQSADLTGNCRQRPYITSERPNCFRSIRPNGKSTKNWSSAPSGTAAFHFEWIANGFTAVCFWTVPWRWITALEGPVGSKA